MNHRSRRFFSKESWHDLRRRVLCAHFVGCSEDGSVDGWIDPMICHEVTLPPSWLADWFKGWTHTGPSNSKVYQLNIDFVGKTLLSFWVPGFFFFSAMWVLGRHGRASPWNMGSKVWPTKILKNSRMVRNPINYTSFKMWGYLDVHL